ncbi:hypothetical protein OBV_30740 [Oscillibacter valericigenes Sjm18-20]|nr:hypothetical protein OBV_30740 [Oscillibacter valericigenes Sjm18-20]
MLIEYFKQYMQVTCNITDKSVDHYVTGINSINTLLEKYNFPIIDIFAVSSCSDLDAIKIFLKTNPEFLNKDSIGHHMYSVAFNHFYRFACTDSDFFRRGINRMDITVAKPEIITDTAAQWKRNQIVIAHSIEGANYCCEHNVSHSTFIARSSGKAYMEGHHLIPLKYQTKFNCGIDVYANVVCLCPVCHRLMHFGRDSERRYVAEMLFDKRSARLSKSGIDIPKKEFIELVIA